MIGLRSAAPMVREDEPSALEKAMAAIAEIDVDLHVDRVNEARSRIEAMEQARAVAQQRLADVRERLKDEVDGEAVAEMLLRGDNLPPARSHLEEERDQLMAGLAALARQINQAQTALRWPWSELRAELGRALEPLATEMQAEAQHLLERLENMYATAVALSGVARSGPLDMLANSLGAMVAEAREGPRWLRFQTDIPVDEAITALAELPALQAMRQRVRSSVTMPSARPDSAAAARLDAVRNSYR